eukprot:g3737.t1
MAFLSKSAHEGQSCMTSLGLLTRLPDALQMQVLAVDAGSGPGHCTAGFLTVHDLIRLALASPRASYLVEVAAGVAAEARYTREERACLGKSQLRWTPRVYELMKLEAWPRGEELASLKQRFTGQETLSILPMTVNRLHDMRAQTGEIESMWHSGYTNPMMALESAEEGVFAVDTISFECPVARGPALDMAHWVEDYTRGASGRDTSDTTKVWRGHDGQPGPPFDPLTPDCAIEDCIEVAAAAVDDDDDEDDQDDFDGGPPPVELRYDGGACLCIWPVGLMNRGISDENFERWSGADMPIPGDDYDLPYILRGRWTRMEVAMRLHAIAQIMWDTHGAEPLVQWDMRQLEANVDLDINLDARPGLRPWQ